MKKKKIKKIVKNKNGKFRYATLIWAALAVWAVYIFITQQISLHEQNAEISEINKNIKIEQKKNEELTETLDTVDSDEYVEKVARENLGYTMPNEQVFVDSTKTK